MAKKKTLKEWMKSRRLTQHMLGEALGVAQPTLCRVVSGENWPTARTMGLLMGFVGDEVAWLAEIKGNKAYQTAMDEGWQYRQAWDAERAAMKLAKSKK